MSLPHATRAHVSRGRLRLRIGRAHRGDDELFARAEAVLGAHPAVHELRIKPRTGSVLIFFDESGDRESAIESIETHARRQELFDVVSAPPTLAKQVGFHAGALRDGLVDPEQRPLALVTVALFGAAAVQFWRGRYLPPGESLLTQAFKVLAILEERADDERSAA